MVTSREVGPSPGAARPGWSGLRGEGPARHLVHPRARDGRAAAGAATRRRGDRPVLHLRVDGERVRAARRADRLRRLRRRRATSCPRRWRVCATSRTRAVVPVHYAGNSCDMDGAAAAAAGDADRRGRRPGARRRPSGGGPWGRLGAVGPSASTRPRTSAAARAGRCWSATRPWSERSEYLRDKGTNRRRFQQGLVDKYTWVDVGSSYVLSDLNAAYLSTQLSELARIQARREAIYRRYAEALAGPVDRIGGYLITHAGPQPRQPPPVRDGAADRGAARPVHRRDAGAQDHRPVPLRPAPPIALWGAVPRRSGAAATRTASGGCLVRLPLFFNQTDEQVERVVTAALDLLRLE